MKPLEDNDLICESQHGFCHQRSTLTNLLIYMEHLTVAMDHQIPVHINYLDYRKAFDTVPHKRLITKLRAYGIRGTLLKWNEDFLTNRR